MDKPYIPKACPPNGDPSFWDNLRSKGITKSSDILEIDIFEYATARRIMRMYLSEEKAKIRECVDEIAKERKSTYLSQRF